jgi:hypothetical protein
MTLFFRNQNYAIKEPQPTCCTDVLACLVNVNSPRFTSKCLTRTFQCGQSSYIATSTVFLGVSESFTKLYAAYVGNALQKEIHAPYSNALRG